jgi:hypothetical protein
VYVLPNDATKLASLPIQDEYLRTFRGGAGLGNIIELCAQRLYPDPKTFLGFTMCLTRDYKHIPQRSLIEDCALEHAIDFDALNECATRDDGALGVGMLRASVKRTAEVIKGHQPQSALALSILSSSNLTKPCVGRPV